MDLIAQFNNILPLACDWARSQELRILEKGNFLSSQLLLDVARIGIIHRDKIRILVVPRIPIPEHPLLKEACIQTKFLGPDTAGLTIGYGIYIKADCANDHSLHIHELVHVAQYERLGGILQFLQKYLFELVIVGYASVSLEQEAIERTREICG